jgi:transposase
LKDDKESLYAHHYKTEKEYKAEFEFLKEALQQARRNLESAYANFFNSLKGARKSGAGFPKFKAKKKHKDSYRTAMSIAVDVDNMGNSPNYVRVYRKGETRLAKYQMAFCKNRLRFLRLS